MNKQYTSPSTRLAVLIAKHEEEAQPEHLRNAAVLQVIDMWLNMFEPPLWQSHIEKSLPKGDME